MQKNQAASTGLKLPSFSDRDPPPLRLAMDEYVDFVAFTLGMVDPERARKQKQLEEQITVPFRLS